MVLGRCKGWVVSEAEMARRVAWFASPEGLAFRKRLSDQMKARWAEQKAGKQKEVVKL